jgi:hypothetical protein
MELPTDNGLQIRNDSIASPEAEGVQGATFVEIDTRQAAGLPLRNGEVLQSLEPDSTNEQAARAMEKIGTVLIEESTKLRQKGTSK